MKILQLIQKPQLRGAEVFACQLSDQLVSLGHESFIVSIFKGDAVLPAKAKQYHMARSRKKRLWDYGGYKQIAEIIRTEKPDVVQANAGDTLRYAVISRLLFRWKLPVVFRNASTISLYIKSPRARLWNGLFFGRVNKVISVSKHSASDFIKLFPSQKEKVISIPIGIESADSNGVIKKNNSPYDHTSGLVIVHVGGFSFEKNHQGLLHIFQRLLKADPSATLHLVGSGPLKPAIEKMAGESGLAKNVIFYGFQPNPLLYIRHADVLVLPSIIEGLPGVILEAFSCKTPVVAYNVGGISEVVIQNKTGRLIAKGDEQEFAEAILEASKTNAVNQEMITNAYELVTSKYLNIEIAKDFLKAYASLSSN